MKTFALAVLGLLSVTLGVLYAQEKAQSHRQAVRLAELETRVNRQSAETLKQTQEVASLGEEKKRLVAKTETMKQKLAAAREAAKTDASQASQTDAAATAEDDAAKAEQAAKDAAKPKGNPLKGYMAGMAKMMKDPAMKQMMRSTQSTAMRQMYGDLIKQWGMSPEESGKFYDLVLDKQMSTLDRSMDAAENGGNAAAAVASNTADADAAIKAALGDNYYQQYKDYEKTVGDRMLLNQYQQRLFADNAPALTSEQSQFLVRTMGEVRQSQAASGDAGSSANPFLSKDGSLSMDHTAVDKFMQQQSAVNAQVAQRAAGMLSVQQLDSFKQYQQQMLDMQRMGMEMAAKMNDGGKP